jgi:hypothetical protein
VHRFATLRGSHAVLKRLRSVANRVCVYGHGRTQLEFGAAGTGTAPTGDEKLPPGGGQVAAGAGQHCTGAQHTGC